MKDKSRLRIAAVVAGIALFAGSSAYISTANKQSTAPQRHRQERVETELLTLHPDGFEPGEIRRPQGAFILGVDNRSGVETIELRFVRADGQRLPVLESPKRKVSWREVVDLTPGQYVLSEVNHPDWTCNVTILPH